MAEMRKIITAGTTGEISPKLYGRVDLTKFYAAFKTLKNFYMYPHGPITRREGTYFVAEAKHRDKACRLIPFIFSVEQSYTLEFGEYYIRVFKDGGSVVEDAVTISGASKASECVITATAHGYSNGDEVYIDSIVGMTELNGKRYRVSDKDTNTFKIKDLAGDYIDSSGFTTYTSGGSSYRVYEITTPYAEADLFEIQFAQSADIMYITHPDYMIRKLSRTAHTSWTIEEAPIEDGPYLPEIVMEHGVTPSAIAGSITLTAKTKNITGATQADPVVITSASHGYINGDIVYITGVVGMTELNDKWYRVGDKATNTFALYDLNGDTIDGSGYTAYSSGGTIQDVVFSSDDVGRHIRFLCTGSVHCWGKITGYTSGTVVTVMIMSADLPDTNDITTIRLGYWGTGNGYPYSCTFHEQRMMYGGCPAYPSTIWGSMAGAGEFDVFTPGVEDADPVVYTLVSNQVNAIKWMMSTLMLLVGTGDSAWTIKSNSLNEPLTPTNVSAKPETNKGAALMLPVLIDRSVVYVHWALRKIFEFGYKYTEEGDSYISTDLSLLAEHITEGGIVDIAYQAEPNSIIWMVLDGGEMVGLTYQKEHDVIGWHRHETDGEFESVCSIPGSTQDDVWVVVNRTIDSITRRYIEYFKPSDYASDIEDAFFVDSGLTYEGEDTDSVTGLDHLEGETVAVLADGAVHDDCVVADGAISLDYEAGKVHVGLPYESLAQYLGPAAGGQGGTLQGRRKTVVKLVLRLINSLGGEVGADENELDDIPYDWDTDLGDATPLVSEDIEVIPPHGYDTKGEFCIFHDKPLPMTVVAVIPKYEIGD